MVCLYITSTDEGAGRTTLCAGLGKHLRDKGQKVGYFKPVIGDKPPAETGDHDALFMKQALGLAEDVGAISPLIAGKEGQAGRVKEAYAGVAAGKDVVIIEASLQPELIAALDARVIAVEDYAKGQPAVRDNYRELGKSLLGVVLNKLPLKKLELVRDEVAADFEGAGIAILAVLPEDRLLYALSIDELVGRLQGEVLNSSERAGELVENIMIGAMTVDPGPDYFGRKGNKAVVVRGNRPDMQMAALETPTVCLVLCGDTPPTPAVLYEADKKKVPVVVTPGGIKDTIDIIEDALVKSRFNQLKKLDGLAKVMGKHFVLGSLYQGLGIAQS